MARKLPKLCHHKAKGLAYATDPFTGREVYFGQWSSDEARAAYGEWIKVLLERQKHGASPKDLSGPPTQFVTVGKLTMLYMNHAKIYYRKDGKETSEVGTLKSALRPLVDLYGDMAANSFGTAELKKVRQRMIELGWVRRSINQQVGRIRRLFGWGVEEGHINASVYGAILTVRPLKEGRSEAKDKPEVGPVPLWLVKKTIRRLDALLAALVQIQLHSAMRPGELLLMRPIDIDQSGDVWKYVPRTHKTKHHNKQRVVWIGPKAQAILQPLLDCCPHPESWVFPTRSRRYPELRGKDHLRVAGYRRAIERACKRKPELPSWHPHQLRHTAATAVRAEFGAEAAQVVVGHATLKATEIYAERDFQLAREVAEKIG